jgi:TonB family protein
MKSSSNSATIFSATTSVGAHLMFVALAGNFFLSQNKPIPIPKRTIKMEVIKKIPLNNTESISEIKRQRFESFDPITLEKLPKIQKPLEKLENLNVRQKTPMVEQRNKTPFQSPTATKREVIEKTLGPTLPVQKESIIPRNASPTPITKSLAPSMMTESNDRATRMTVPSQKKREPQTINQSTSARNSVASPVSKATRAPHKNLNSKQFPIPSVPKVAPSSEGRLMDGRAQRFNTAKFQNKAVQADTVEKSSGLKKGSSLIETSSSRVPLNHITPITPGKIENAKSTDTKEKSTAELSPPRPKRLASLGVEPRSVPDVYEVDPKLLQGYSTEIQRKISASIKYPKRAKRKGRQGQMMVRFKVLKSGEIQDLILVTRTPYKELDRAGLKAVRKAAPFPSLPEGIEQDFLVLELPIRFEIN